MTASSPDVYVSEKAVLLHRRMDKSTKTSYDWIKRWRCQYHWR